MSTRLSPAASLLRNSKLFALPPAVALPPAEASSEPIPRSSTATTIYPTRAAIETPLSSLNRGDWGFKRQLPLKSTTKTGTPVVRLAQGIDTAEHIADFESAADHVLTLKKFQELNQSIQLPKSGNTRSADGRLPNVFLPTNDNTTNLTSSSPAHARPTGVWPSLSQQDLQKQIPDRIRRTQIEIEAIRKAQDTAHTDPTTTSTAVVAEAFHEQKRWRYAGPSLLLMSGMEFNAYLKSLGPEKKAAFREKVKQEMVRERAETARDEGRVGENDLANINFTEEEVSTYLRALRADPKRFGPLLVDFLDIPEGPIGNNVRPNKDVFEYGRRTLATDKYEESGPPRTHPSAGLSYIHNSRFANNDAEYGPQNMKQAVVARIVKTRTRGSNNIPTYGVAGFIVSTPNTSNMRGRDTAQAFEPQPGGQKIPVRPVNATVNEQGALTLQVERSTEYIIQNEKIIHSSERRHEQQQEAITNAGRDRVMPSLTGAPRSTSYKKREDVRPDQDVDAVLKQLQDLSSAGPAFGSGRKSIGSR